MVQLALLVVTVYALIFSSILTEAKPPMPSRVARRPPMDHSKMARFAPTRRKRWKLTVPKVAELTYAKVRIG
ncbi:hypothetical protein V3C99_006890 [Haemonchus contortus]